MSCNIEPTNKKEFGINVYNKLNEKFGYKNYYTVPEIKEIIKILEYPDSYECWAFVAFMMPANVGEYFRAQGTPMNVLEMKKKFISEMTDNKRDSLSLPQETQSKYESKLKRSNLINWFSYYHNRDLGFDITLEIFDII